MRGNPLQDPSDTRQVTEPLPMRQRDFRMASTSKRRQRRARSVSIRALLAVSVLVGIATGITAKDLMPPARPAVMDISGPVRVVDGDTIDIAGQRIRLQGLDAPEQGQTCFAQDQEWNCGQRATSALIGLIGSQRVDCRAEGRDRYGRTIGFCWVGDTDIGQWLVRGGHAVAYWRYSWRYGIDEIRARLAGAGVWQGDFQRPEDWRRARR